MKIKLTFILTLILCLVFMAPACTERQTAPTPITASQSGIFKVTPSPEPTAEITPASTAKPTLEPTPAPTIEPFGAEIWAEIRAQGFSSVDDEQFQKLRSALYAEVDEDDELWSIIRDVYSSVDVYLSDIITREKAVLNSEPEPTKSIDDMSHYELAYYYATPEQRERLENIKKPTGDYGDYIRQIWMITGKLAEDTPRLTLEQAREICADAIALNKTGEDAVSYIYERFMEICGAPDHIHSNISFLGSAHLFYLDDDAAEYIYVQDCFCDVDYVNEAAGINEQLLP